MADINLNVGFTATPESLRRVQRAFERTLSQVRIPAETQAVGGVARGRRTAQAAGAAVRERQDREAQRRVTRELNRRANLQREFNRRDAEIQTRVDAALRRRAAEAERSAERFRQESLASSVQEENRRRQALERLTASIQRSITQTDRVTGARRELNNAIRQRIRREQAAGALPTAQAGAAGTVVPGAAGLQQFAAGLDTRQIERLRAILREATLESRRFAQEQRTVEGATRRTDNAARRLSGSLRNAERGFRRGGASAIGFRERVFRATQTVLAFAGPTAVIFGFINRLQEATSEIIRLDQQARRLVFFQEAGPFLAASNGATQFNITAGQLNSTISQLLQTSIRTGVALSEVTEVFVTATRIGQRADSQFTNTVLSLVRLEAGALNAEQAVRLLNAIQIQFLNNLERFDRGIADAAIVNVGALIATTAARSAFNVEQLANALSRVGPAFTSIQGTTIEQAIAIIGTAASATGADVGRLSTTLRQLTTLVVQNAQEIEATSGVRILDARGQIRDFEAILEFLEEIRDLSGTAQAVQLALQGADRRNVASVLALARNVDALRTEFEALDTVEERVAASTRAAIVALEAEESQSQSIQAGINRLSTAFTQFIESPAVRDFLVDLLDRGVLFINALENIVNSTSRFRNEISAAVDIINNLNRRVGVSTEGLDRLGRGLRLFLGIPGIFAEITDSLRESNSQSQIFTEEQRKQIAATDARIRALQKERAEQQRLAEETRIRNLAEAENIALTQEIISITRRLVDAESDAAEVVRLQDERKALIQRRNRLAIRDVQAIESAERRIRENQRAILVQRAQEQRRLEQIKTLQEAIGEFSTEREKIELEFTLKTEELDRQIDLTRREIEALEFRIDFGGFDEEEIRRLDEERFNLGQRLLQEQDRRQGLILDRQRDIADQAFSQAQQQITAWEGAANSVTEAFRDVLGLQEGLAELFSNQGEIAAQRIEAAFSTAANFLETSGANIETRLAFIRTQSDRQIAEIRRLGQRQLRTIRDTGVESFIDVEDVAADTQRVADLVGNALVAASQGAESERQQQVRETEESIRRIRADNAQAEFNQRVDQTRREIQIRNNLLQQELNLVQQRLGAERELQELRISQQEQFGRLLIESPERFGQTIRDIQLATAFFRDVTDININGLRQISSRINQLRGAGQVSIIQGILRGLEASAQFGRQDIVGGVGTRQLQSIFERLQLNLPTDVAQSLEEQAQDAANQSALQRRIQDAQIEQERLAQFDITLQEAQIRIASAAADVARAQRQQIVAGLALQTATFSADLRNLEIGIVDVFRQFGGDPAVGGALRPTVGRVDVDTNIQRFNNQLPSTSDAIERLRNVTNQAAQSLGVVGQQAETETGPAFRDTTIGLSDALSELTQQIQLSGRGIVRFGEERIRGGRETQGLRIARRGLVGEGGEEIVQGFRNLLQTTAAGQTDFVQELRRIREDGVTREEVTQLRQLLGERGFGGAARDISTRGQGQRLIDRFLRLSEQLTQNTQNISRDTSRAIERVLGAEISDGLDRLSDGIREVVREQQREVGRPVIPDLRRAVEEAREGFQLFDEQQVGAIRTSVRDAVSEGVQDSFAGISERVGDAVITAIRDNRILVDLPRLQLDFNGELRTILDGSEFIGAFEEVLAGAGLTAEQINRIRDRVQQIAAVMVRNDQLAPEATLPGTGQ